VQVNVEAFHPGSVARAEYPRPRLVRSEWYCLNGPWEFSFDPADKGLQSEAYLRSSLEREIIVPFSYQTALSGIDDRQVCEVVWYAKNFELPEDWEGKSILLHFGAVDYEATIWINGATAGTHRGGYVPFSLDITRLLKEGVNRVTVRVMDSQDPGQPRGKQSSSGLPFGIDYWCTTGIWQSVWLEPVSPSYIGDVVVSSDIERGQFLITPVIYGSRTDIDIEITVFDGSEPVAKKLISTTFHSQPIELSVPKPKLWQPNSPHLYALELRLFRGGEPIDLVRSYAGMRSVEARNGAILLNKEPIYLKMVLDQGYWPESGLTAPTDTALERDVLLVKQLGFNAVRKHQKVEDPRWLYWCDVHGLLVWGEMANARSWSFETQEKLETEWARVIERDRSHPCIVAWVPLNESMGFPNLGAGHAPQIAGVERLVHLTRRLDPSRPVIDNDGWEQTDASDIVAIHDYSHSGAELKSRYLEYSNGGELPERIWTGARTSLLPGVELDGRPIMLTEVGGFLMLPKGEGSLDVMYSVYGSIGTSRELLDKYRELMNAIGTLPFLSGFCYTQFTDVEQEMNGLLQFDREPKADLDEIREIHENMR
jgi:beta-galactosidase/beta-glucuronidase